MQRKRHGYVNGNCRSFWNGNGKPSVAGSSSLTSVPNRRVVTKLWQLRLVYPCCFRCNPRPTLFPDAVEVAFYFMRTDPFSPMTQAGLNATSHK
jgi:hypothetical protein